MENQHNNQVSKELAQFRKEIDEIDNQIIKLLDKRVKIVGKVGEHKKKNNEKFLIRSNREADMIKSLAARCNSAIPKSVIVDIWRKIITCANFLEQDLKIAIHNPKKIASNACLIREYYGDFVPIINHDSVNSMILAIEKAEVQIGIFVLPEPNREEIDENWWAYLANNDKLKVYAKLPFVERVNDFGNERNLVAVAMKQPEQSSEDKTLLSIEISNDIPKSKLLDVLKAVQIDFKILKSTRLTQVNNIVFNLVEIDGFFEDGDELIKKIAADKIKPYIKVIGHYPTPIKLG
ncbi:MAG: chorismate mutase [Proteobacteria bacterium]|nr:chorismate mutase [Pseudomonadota bacterium]